MPSSNHRRNLSWPPIIQIIDALGAEDALPNIDDDPFSYFLSPIKDDDGQDDALAWSAGIVDPPSTKQSTLYKFIERKWEKFVAKDVPELHERYHNTEEKNSDDIEEYIWPEQGYRIDRMNWSPPHQRPHSLTEYEPLRGRIQSDRLHAQLRRNPQHLSVHRRSWREPSPEISTVLEEPENGVEATDNASQLSLDNEVIVEGNSKGKQKIESKL